MVLSSWQSHCESSPGSFVECRTAPSGRWPKTKPDDLGCEFACTGCHCNLHSGYRLGVIWSGYLYRSFFCHATLCIAWPMLSCDVCPSVCLSHSCIVLKQVNISHHWSFFVPNIMAIFRWGTPKRGIKRRWGMKKLWFSISYSLYLRNDTR